MESAVSTRWCYSNVSIAMVKEMFPNKVILRRGDIMWPAHSPDLLVCNYFFWGYLKPQVYVRIPRNIKELKNVIQEEITAILNDMFHSAIQNLYHRLQQCILSVGSYLRDVL